MTHQSTTDPEARLAHTNVGKEATRYFSDHVLMENGMAFVWICYSHRPPARRSGIPCYQTRQGIRPTTVGAAKAITPELLGICRLRLLLMTARESGGCRCALRTWCGMIREKQARRQRDQIHGIDPDHDNVSSAKSTSANSLLVSLQS